VVNEVPDRGDVVWVDLDPTHGHEQSGRRPLLVLSPSFYNGRTSLLLGCPITSQSKGYRFEIAIPAGVSVVGVVLADQLKSVDWRARKARFITTLPAHLVGAVQASAAALLGFAP
jgi:mRNA interferase MazF